MSSVAITGNASGAGVFTIASPNSASSATITLPTVTGGSFVVSNASGNVGIGTTSPTNGKLVITGNSVTTAQGIRLTGDTAEARFICESATIGAGILGTFSTHPQLFYTDSAERMRIDSSGAVGVGSSSPSTFGRFVVSQPNVSPAGWFHITATSTTSVPAVSFVKQDNDSTTSQVLVNFYINGSLAGQGQINANGANAAAFGAFSDSRLKENIVEISPQLANIMALRPVEFDYIASEGGGHQIGFVAQEVQAIYPDLVGERADGMLTLSDMNKNDARLIKAIQEQQALITSLTARIAALEGTQS